MTAPVLHPVCVAISAAASISTLYPTDYRFTADHQERLVVVKTLNASDSIIIRGCPDYWDPTTGQAASSPTEVTITATLTATNPVTVISGPWAGIRVQKIGANGAAVVKLII